ncbi:hypothetical protein EDF24_3425 [Curtobacterium sp. PhB130]|uniref:hypothetical protein n=1 Tax=Curtobacterium sp. PhB130 TaxID=2485178 RepID=UPI000F9FEDFE|nr:hypothetical protein [Curtobacterium sp. PhB130]ROS72165.1 hypothetical protein EDF24_3425 [Curtobacterium sp. PhB130]
MTALGIIATLFAMGVVFGGLGALAYAGRWRSWLGRVHENFVFGWFWLGLALLSMGLAASFVRTPVFGVSLVFAFTAAVTGALGVWSVVMGVPRWLQPRWYRVARER